MFWSQRPFIRIFLYFVSGILLWHGGAAQLFIEKVWLLTATGLLFIVYWLLVVFNKRYSLRWVTGVSFGLLFIFLGMLLSQMQQSSFVSLPREKNQWIGQIVSDPQISSKTVKAEMMLFEADRTDVLVGDSPKILGYFEKGTPAETLRYGDVIVFSGHPEMVDGPRNPDEFDFQAYLSMKNIHYSLYLKETNWRLLYNDPPNWWLLVAFEMRKRLQTLLQRSALNDEEYAVASAILLGNDDLMDSELRSNYVYAGAMHILCVSGLHVGIIFLVFNFLLGFLERSKRLRVVKVLLLLLIVWVYASVTGLSPSVQRAGLMVSIFIIGQLIRRRRDNLNTLAVSAVILLLIDPTLLFHIGFQLSYAAVAGILILHPPFYAMIFVKNSILDKVWSITALSMAAQLATFPLAVHYFHFFPTWFWLTNLFTYPLSFLILTGGMATMLFSWVPVLSGILGWLLSGLVFILNYSVALVKLLPMPGLTRLYLSTFEVVVIYLMIALFFMFFVQKRWKILLPAMFVLVVLVSMETLQHWQHLQQSGLVVYQLRKHSAIQLVEGRRSHVLADSVLAADLSLADFSIQAAQARWGLEYPEVVDLHDSLAHNIGSGVDGHFYSFRGQRIMILKNKEFYFPTPQRLRVDMLLVTGKPKVKPERLLEIFDMGTLIADGSVPYYYKKKLRMMADSSGLKYHDTSQTGAYVWGLE